MVKNFNAQEKSAANKHDQSLFGSVSDSLVLFKSPTDLALKPKMCLCKEMWNAMDRELYGDKSP
jgi:hypothetical protein